MIRQDVIDNTENIINEYLNSNSTIKDLSIKYSCDSRTISNILKNNNIDKKADGFWNRKYTLDENVFDAIDTPEKAYTLGFLYADGCNYPSGKISISLAIYDRDILEKIRCVFKSTAPLIIRDGYSIPNTQYIGSPTINLTLHSIELSRRLNDLGVIHNKTKALEFPDFIPQVFIKDFVRGYFDGDGSITIGRHNKPKISLISTKKFLQGLATFYDDSWLRKIYGKKDLDENIGLLELNSLTDVKNFCEWIYNGATIYSERKYNRYYSYFFKGEELHKYPKLSNIELLTKYGYNDVIPEYK